MPPKKNSEKLSVSIDAGASVPSGSQRAPASDGSSIPKSPNGSAPRRQLKIATVSHTLDFDMAERLRYFAFRERISESAVIEYALGAFFKRGDDAELGTLLREAGAALRRKV